MPEPTHDSTPQTPAGHTPSPKASPGGRPPAPPEVRLEHAQDRWSGWLSQRDREDRSSKLRFYFIAGVIVVGTLIWFLSTR